MIMSQGDVSALRDTAGNVVDEIIEDFSESICALCESGGDMICCDGKCLRSFHPSCIGLREEDIPEDSPFICSDCVNGIQRCFQCKHFGVASQLIKCRVPFCGKFYHADVSLHKHTRSFFTSYSVFHQLITITMFAVCTCAMIVARQPY